MDEQQLNDVFGRAVDGAVPELDRLVAGAETDGQRLRLRRRAAMAGTVLTVAAVAVGGGLLLRPGTAGGADLAAAGPGATLPGAAPSASVSTPPTATPSPGDAGPTSERPDGMVPLTGPALVYNLIQLLPPGMTQGDFAGQTTPGTSRTDVSGRAMVRLGAGATPVGVNIQTDFLRYGGAPGTTTAERVTAHYDCTRMARNNPCTIEHLPDGSVLLRSEQPEEPGVVYRYVDLYRPDGVRIVVSCSNSADDKRPPVLADAPALTFEQLTAIATSPSWHERITPEAAASAQAKVIPYRDLNG